MLQKRSKMPRSPPFREVQKSQEAIASAHRSIEARPLLLRAQKNREKNSPINLLSSKSSKLTVQVHRNLPLTGSSTICAANSRNPHISLFRTSAGSAHSHNK
uniref:TPX2_importin domain-containing protein n=1 Tax=Heterorhabditis bacteriophora TaxID=37862 RepID=A0A1I7WL63_HETBA